jgi:hypothetical protein
MKKLVIVASAIVIATGAFALQAARNLTVKVVDNVKGDPATPNAKVTNLRTNLLGRVNADKSIAIQGLPNDTLLVSAPNRQAVKVVVNEVSNEYLVTLQLGQ